MSDTQTSKAVILAYWKSWQTKDWAALRASLADSLDFGGRVMKADDFVQSCQQGNPWKDVELIDSLFTPEGGALMYEGTDASSGKRTRVGELVRVRDGKVCGAHACFGSGTPPQ